MSKFENRIQQIMINGNQSRKLKSQTPNAESFLRRDITPDKPLDVKIDEMFENNDTISINIMPSNRIE